MSESPPERETDSPPRLLDVPEAATAGFELVERGDHVAAREEAERLLGSEGEEELAAGALLQAAVRPDPWALRTAAILVLGFALIGWLALVPHPTVRVARRVLDVVAASQETEARAFFSEEGWQSGGRQLYSGFAGRGGRAYERSPRAKELGFVMISFDRPSGGGPGPNRYLLFEPEGDLIRSVRAARPRPPKTP